MMDVDSRSGVLRVYLGTRLRAWRFEAWETVLYCGYLAQGMEQTSPYPKPYTLKGLGV